MKLSRIDQIALNGATGEHYKYEKIAAEIVDSMADDAHRSYKEDKAVVMKILVENFPNDET